MFTYPELGSDKGTLDNRLTSCSSLSSLEYVSNDFIWWLYFSRLSNCYWTKWLNSDFVGVVTQFRCQTDTALKDIATTSCT